MDESSGRINKSEKARQTNISETIDKIITLEEATVGCPLDIVSHKKRLADILQKFLDSGGVGTEYEENKGESKD